MWRIELHIELMIAMYNINCSLWEVVVLSKPSKYKRQINANKY